MGNIDYPRVWNVGVIGMFSIHGGSLTWDPSLFAASVDGFGGFLFMLNRKGRSGGFFGGRMLLSSDPSSQADFFLAISSQHLEREVRNSARLLSGMFLFITWLTALGQLSSQSPFKCHLAHIQILPVQAGRSCGRIVTKLSFHNSPVVSLNSTGCVEFLTRFPFPSSLFCFFRAFPSLLPSLFLSLACLLSVDADDVAAKPLILANDSGRFMWKVSLRTVSIRFLNWRILLLI